MNSAKTYVVDGQLMSMNEMRKIVSDILGHGPVAKHYPVYDIIRILRNDNREVKTFAG